MSRVILISDLDTEVGFQLLKVYYANGYKIIGFSTGEPERLPLEEFNRESLEVVRWNRISPVGVKNIILQGVSRFQQIDEAVILQTGTCRGETLAEITVVEINRCVDLWIKGNFILLKELLHYFAGRKQGGAITCLSHIEHSGTLSPLVEVLDASFHALLKPLFKSLQNEPIRINGIDSMGNNYVKLGEFVHKITSEKARKTSGRFFRFSDRKSLLSGLR